MNTTITGHDAIAHAAATGAQLRKHADPIDGARDITLDEAREIAREDVGLIYCDAPEYDGAHITVETHRGAIDPQGIGTDEEFESARKHILDAVRDAFPGATVRAVGNGGRTGGVMPDGTDLTNEVRAVVADAWQSWLATA